VGKGGQTTSVHQEKPFGNLSEGEESSARDTTQKKESDSPKGKRSGRSTKEKEEGTLTFPTTSKPKGNKLLGISGNGTSRRARKRGKRKKCAAQALKEKKRASKPGRLRGGLKGLMQKRKWNRGHGCESRGLKPNIEHGWGRREVLAFTALSKSALVR